MWRLQLQAMRPIGSKRARKEKKKKASQEQTDDDVFLWESTKVQ